MSETPAKSRILPGPGQLFLVLLALLLILGGWSVYAGPALAKHRAAARIEQLEKMLKPHGGEAKQGRTPHWLKLPTCDNAYLGILFDEPLNGVRKWLDEGGIPTVSVHVDLGKLRPEERLQLYRRLRESNTCFLEVRHVTDDDIEEIGRIGSLSDMSIATTHGFSQAAQERLSRIPVGFIDLELEGPEITDARLRGLGKFRRLGRLTLKDCAVTDTGLKELHGLPLHELNLSGCRITDAGMKEMASLPKLSFLYLQRTAITDLGMKTLAGGSRNLLELDLRNTAVTDAGLLELADLRELREVMVGPAITPEGIRKFSGSKAGYHCDVTSRPPSLP